MDGERYDFVPVNAVTVLAAQIPVDVGAHIAGSSIATISQDLMRNKLRLGGGRSGALAAPDVSSTSVSMCTDLLSDHRH